MFRFSRFVSCIGLLSVVGCDGGPTRPAPIDQAFPLRGVVYETAPTETTPVPGARVEVVDGRDTGKAAVTDGFGTYTIPDLSGQVTVRAEKEGYEPDTKNLSVNSSATADFNIHPITPWPAELSNMLNKLSVPDGLRLREVPQWQPRKSFYHHIYRIVVYISPSPTHGKVGAIAHEIGHAHQHRLVLDTGRELHDWVRDWAATPEGKDYLEITGWQVSGPEPPCELWGCGYPNALEDNAQFCAQWFDPTPPHTGPEYLRQVAPKRYQWATKWLAMP